MALSICGVLLAQACNVGFGPVTRRDTPALAPGRLEWVTANFVRAETIRAANDRLLAYHQHRAYPKVGYRRARFG